MSLQKQQNFLAKLYTNAELRRAFSSDSEQIGTQHDLNKSEIAEIAEIMPEELNFFAESLFWKRLREVEKFLPITQRILGEGFTNLFRQFAKNFNPQTVKKHLEDSIEFCKFLQKQNGSEIAKNAVNLSNRNLNFSATESDLFFVNWILMFAKFPSKQMTCKMKSSREKLKSPCGSEPERERNIFSFEFRFLLFIFYFIKCNLCFYSK